MLTAFAERAGRLTPPVPFRTVEGSWPQVADQVGAHDVVLCHHVVYDVPDIAGFVAALTAAARHRVVLELMPRHPMTWLNPLWLKFHGLERPARPTSGDLVAVLHEAGVRALTVDRWTRADVDGLTPQERVALVTRRLCLPVAREPDVAAALAAGPAARPAARRHGLVGGHAVPPAGPCAARSGRGSVGWPGAAQRGAQRRDAAGAGTGRGGQDAGRDRGVPCCCWRGVRRWTG